MQTFTFEVEAYRERLGEKAFLRHLNYIDGAVQLMGIDAGRLLAWVEGSGEWPYQVEMGEDGFEFCTCPAFTEASVCKHLPAVAHAANALGADEVRELSRRFERLREALSFESQSVLIERLLTLAKRAPGVLEALEEG